MRAEFFPLQSSNGGHSGAVMSLSWNHMHRQLLASGSADNTIKLWDLNTLQSIQTMTHHKDKVQSVLWHRTEPTVMLSGCYDKTVSVIDVRSPKTPRSWQLPADCESVCWNPHSASGFMVATEDGTVTCFDAMMANPVWTLQAHHKSTSGSFSFAWRVVTCLQR
jgi:periodic tryptophan protein 1